jgi:hypothetical protein
LKAIKAMTVKAQPGRMMEQIAFLIVNAADLKLR